MTTPMPEPVGWANHNTLTGQERITRMPVQSLQPGIYRHTKLYNEDQMEAYAAAKVREALEGAAMLAMSSHPDTTPSWIAGKIRRLIPSTPA